MRKEFQQRLLRHINFLEVEIEDYTKFKALKKKEYITDRDKRRSVERWVENIINSSVDISKIILLLEDINLPDSYKEIVASVSAVEDLSAVEAEALSNWVKFRNIVTHEYIDIRWASISKFIDQTNPLYKKFLEKVKGYLEKRLKT